MRRRELLRLLAVAGLAGCAPGDSARPSVTASPIAGPPRTPSPRATSRPSATPAATATPTAPPSPSPEPVPASDPTPEPTQPAASPEPSPDPEPEPPAPSPEATPDDPDGDARTVVAVGRDGLGLPAPRSGGRAHAITGLAVHHTASPTADASTAPGRFRGITRSHQEDQGWVDVAYHWGVDVDGNVYELRSASIAGDTNTDYDPAGWFLVVCEGNFEESAPPQAMLDAVADVLAYGAARYGVSPSTLRGHRDLAATLCPGANLQARLGEVRGAVEQRLAAGGVGLRVEDDPDRVREIEQG